MSTEWAENNLKTIRHLMESSALYRRALGPISIWIGLLGLSGATLGFLLFPQLPPLEFALFWLLHALAGICGGFFIMRRQALKDGEPLFSLPAKRVIQALAPAIAAGSASLVALSSRELATAQTVVWAILSWIALYGCAVHAAGFFMRRGIKWFGWIFIGSSLVLATVFCHPKPKILSIQDCHLLMGIIFGGFHLTYGIYLQVTEKTNHVP